eukprot:35915_1
MEFMLAAMVGILQLLAKLMDQVVGYYLYFTEAENWPTIAWIGVAVTVWVVLVLGCHDRDNIYQHPVNDDDLQHPAKDDVWQHPVNDDDWQIPTVINTVNNNKTKEVATDQLTNHLMITSPIIKSIKRF